MESEIPLEFWENAQTEQLALRQTCRTVVACHGLAVPLLRTTGTADNVNGIIAYRTVMCLQTQHRTMPDSASSSKRVFELHVFEVAAPGEEKNFLLFLPGSLLIAKILLLSTWSRLYTVQCTANYAAWNCFIGPIFISVIRLYVRIKWFIFVSEHLFTFGIWDII